MKTIHDFIVEHRMQDRPLRPQRRAIRRGGVMDAMFRNCRALHAPHWR